MFLTIFLLKKTNFYEIKLVFTKKDKFLLKKTNFCQESEIFI